jgi:uncharacterized protein YjbI with pentapeptide repeats
MPHLNFTGQNLKNRSFRNQNLTEADFSNADIRSSDFSGAILEGANFRGAIAGLEPKKQLRVIAIEITLAGIAGLIAALAAGIFFISFFEHLKSSTVIIALALTVILAISVIKYGYIAIAGGLVVGVAIAGAGIGELVGTLPGALVIALFLIVGGFGAITGAGIYATIGKWSVLIAGVGSMAGALILPVVVRIMPLKGNVNDVLAGIMALVIAGAVEVLAGIVAHSALNGNERLTFIRTWAIALAAIGGTSFYGADLTDADFTSATLKSTDLRKANLTRTRWHQAKMLDLVRPGATYLQFPQVRQLLITGQGQAENFDRHNLRGVNLQGAILADASFIGADLSEANLQDANLSRAKLVQTQLDETDLTGAMLTGATIEDWGITSHTRLHGVRCEYAFMRVPTKEDPNPRRKPDNWAETFKDGDFADFIKPIVDTLDLYHNQGVDPRAIAISFKQLAENHPDAELEIVAMEKRGKDKFLFRAATAPDADHSQLNAEYFTTYNQIKALAEPEIQALLAEKDSRISSLENMVETALQRPSFYTNNQIQEVTNMTNNPGGFSIGGSVGGSAYNLQGEGNQGVLGDNNQVTQGEAAALAEEPLTKADVIGLLAELDKLLRGAELPEDIKEEATMYLGAAKKATEKEEPKKETALTNLQSVAETLETASKAAKAGESLWSKAKPIILKVAGWLGAAAGSYFMGL